MRLVCMFGILKAIAHIGCRKQIQPFLFSIRMASSRCEKGGMPTLIAVTQLSPTSDKEANFDVAKNIIERAAHRGAKMIFLPEACDYIGESLKGSLESAETLDGPTVGKFCSLAETLGVWLSLGGLHIKMDGEDKIDNTHIIVNEFGKVVSKYQKSHLFEVEIPESNISLHESTYVNYGHSSLNSVETPCGRVALGICYDLRFPEFSLLQRKMGAQILTFPSAFTIPTGMAHWHTLLRARAIETQCYVVASALTGKHNMKRSSYGHSLIVDPWGAVIAETSEGQNFALAEVNLDYLRRIRREMPVLMHRRNDLYSLLSCDLEPNEPCLAENLPIPAEYVNYQFGPKFIPGSCMFLKTRLSFASVNKKCFMDGHVLVICDKPRERFVDLTPPEMSDLSQAVWMTVLITMEKYSGRIEIIVQDGPDAGQTIPQVHFHVMPLSEDSETMTQGYDDEDVKQGWRDLNDMKTEAFAIRDMCSNKLNQWLMTEDIPKPIRLIEGNSGPAHTFMAAELSKDQIILASERNFVFPAPDPILEGHTIICPCNPMDLLQLTPGEIVDHFLTVQETVKALERIFKNASTTIFTSSLQDLNNAMITHVIPRAEKDLDNNDDIYNLLLKYQQALPQLKMVKIEPPSWMNKI